MSKAQSPAIPNTAAADLARTLVQRAGDTGGHALFFGAVELGVIDALLAETQMQITVVEEGAERVSELRRAYDARGVYGKRITFHVGDARSFQAPPYFAHLVVAPPRQIAAAYTSVRPYGGILFCREAVQATGLEKARVEMIAGGHLIIREGALPGAADWTHQYGDIGNTVKSDDRRVRAPLGVLWFGGSSNMDVLPRHAHGPPEQVVGGRLYIEGLHLLSARDVYTGRILWQHDFKDLGTYGIYFNETYADTPLSTSYNQKHIPGANARGTNFVATEDSVYMALKGECQVLDARTGESKRTIKLHDDAADAAQWGFIGVLEDLLIGGDGFAHFNRHFGAPGGSTATTIEDYSASAGLAVFDRHSGALLWRAKARHSFLHNAIVAGNGRIYCIDKLTAYAENLLKRRGADLPKDYRIVCFNAHTGEVLWQQEESIFGTWLGYSQEHDILLQAGSKASDRLSTEVGAGMIAYEGRSGRVRWQDLKRSYTGPCILHNELILTGANSYSSSGGAFNLLTGAAHLVKNPLTGNMEPWRLNRTYGCNTIIASEHLLTYRSGAAGFYDLDSMSGTANLGGFKSGCTSNLVVANGVLNAPDYTRTCSCAYQNQTSLALISMPDMEMWSYSQFGIDAKQGDRILHAGINFGAPGNRRAADGTLWLEYPHVGDGNSPKLGVACVGSHMKWFRHHSSTVTAAEGSQPWIAASGFVGEADITITPSLRRPMLVKPGKKSDDDDDDHKVVGGKSKSQIKPKAIAPQTQEPLLKIGFPTLLHTVRLHFADPEHLPSGARVFDVLLQGRKVVENFDLAREGGATVREFRDIPIGAELRLQLQSAAGATAPPVLSGVEFVVQQGAQ